MEHFEFPHVQKSIEDFLYDEEGNIPMNKVLTIGSVVMILGLLLGDDTYAGHRSHSSHSSHESGVTGRYGPNNYVNDTTGGGGGGTGGGGASKAAAAKHASHSNVAPDASTMQNMRSLSSTDHVNLDTAAQTVSTPETAPATTGGQEMEK
nr:His-Xaa-Ser repeat protein HxsA3 [uncultured Mitsuokella sp.]